MVQTALNNTYVASQWGLPTVSDHDAALSAHLVALFFSLLKLLLLWPSFCFSSPVSVPTPEEGGRAELLYSTWDLPGPGMEPTSPALAGGFLPTVPLGKPFRWLFKNVTHGLILMNENRNTA